MYLGKLVGVVVPAYNEERHVRGVVETLPEIVDRAYVVDDGSSDGTWEEIERATRDRPGCRVGSVTGGGGSEATPPERVDGGGGLERVEAQPPGDPTREPDGGRASRGNRPPLGGAGDDLTGGLMAIEAATGAARPPDGPEQAESAEAETVDAVDRRADRLARVTAAAHGDDPGDDLLLSVPEDGTGPDVVAVRHGENRGRGGAVKTGYRLALAEATDVVVVMDGDGQMNPDNVERLVHPVAAGRADYAKGNRLNSPRYWAGMSRFRLFGNVVLTGLTRVASGYWRLRDPQNGYTAISRETLSELPVEDLYDDYGFLNDVLVKLHVADARVADVAMAAVYGDEESGIRYSSFVPALSLLLFRDFVERLYHEWGGAGNHAVPVAYGLAALGCVAAFLLGVLVVAGLPLPSPWPVVGGLFGSSALVAALAVRLDGRRSLHLQRRVSFADGAGDGSP